METILWPKETSICSCLLRMSLGNFREHPSEWAKRMKEHYKEEVKCLQIAMKNKILICGYPDKENRRKLVASLWKIDEEDLKEEWGMGSRGLNNE